MTERLLTPKQVAELLQVHPKTVYGWARNGELPCLRIGKVVRFRWSDIEARHKDSLAFFEKRGGQYGHQNDRAREVQDNPLVDDGDWMSAKARDHGLRTAKKGRPPARRVEE